MKIKRLPFFRTFLAIAIGLILLIPTSVIIDVEGNDDDSFTNLVDYDEDGLNDTIEKDIGTNYRLWDSDGDGLSDGDEYYIYKTDPTRLSTDGDLYDDGMEILGYSPRGDMPNYVQSPGDSPFVAAFPDISFEVSEDIDILIKEEISDIKGHIEEKITEGTYTITTTEQNGYLTYLAEDMSGFSNNFINYLNKDLLSSYEGDDIDLFDEDYISGKLTTLGVSKRKEIDGYGIISDSNNHTPTRGILQDIKSLTNYYDSSNSVYTYCNNNAPEENDSDHDDLPDNQEEFLSKKYCPLMLFHKDEVYFPTTIDFALEHSDLRQYRPFHYKNLSLIKEGPLNISDITEADEKTCLSYDYGSSEKLDFFINNYYEKSPDYTPNYKYNFSIYSRVYPQLFDFNNDGILAKYIIVQYWFYYVYDYLEYGNKHEGDWEQIQFILDENENPLFAAYSQHYDGEIKHWSEVQKTSTHNPIVYVAKGSHASYFSQYLNNNHPDNAQLYDRCGTETVKYMKFPNIILLEDNDQYSSGNKWMKYKGLWGKYGMLFFSGVNGPRYQFRQRYGNIIGDEINRWKDPLLYMMVFYRIGLNIPKSIENNLYPESAGLIEGLTLDGISDTYDEGKIFNKNEDQFEVNSVVDTSNYHGTGNEMSFNVITQKENYHSIQSTKINKLATSEFWMTANTSKTHDAAELRFLFTIKNSGTDVARTVEGIRFEIEIGNDTHPITYPSLYEDLKISNLFPGEVHTFSVNPGISITYNQLKLIDNGAKINITLKDFSFGEDELFYENAYEQNIIFEIDYGESLDEQIVHTYMCYIGENYTYLDALNQAIPVQIDNETLISIGNCEINDHSWWNVFNTKIFNGSFIFALAEPKQKVLMRYYKDSDKDGYTDQLEYDMNYDMNNPESHPSPCIIGNITYETINNDCIGKLTLNNFGDYQATNVESIIFSPDSTTTIIDGFQGGGGTLEKNQTFTIFDDQFHYEINSPFYNEPILIVKYNDPNKNHLILFNNSLNPSIYHEFRGVDFQVPYLCSYFDDNEIVAIINNPTNNNWTNMCLFLNIYTLGGSLLKSYQKNISVIAGDNQFWFKWNPSDIIQNNDTNKEYKIQVVFTDHNNLIIDSEIKYFMPVTYQYPGETGSCQIYPEQWNFGNRSLNETFEREFSIINTGRGNLELFLEFSKNISSNDILLINSGISTLYSIEPAGSLDFMVTGNSDQIGTYHEYIRVLSSDPMNYVSSFQIQYTINGNQTNVISESSFNIKINFTSISLTPNYPNINDTIKVNLNIINEGQFPMQNLSISVNNGSYENIVSEISRIHIFNFESNSSLNVNVTFKYSGQSHIVLFLDCDEIVEEWNEFDNVCVNHRRRPETPIMTRFFRIILMGF